MLQFPLLRFPQLQVIILVSNLLNINRKLYSFCLNYLLLHTHFISSQNYFGVPNSTQLTWYLNILFFLSFFISQISLVTMNCKLFWFLFSFSYCTVFFILMFVTQLSFLFRLSFLFCYAGNDNHSTSPCAIRECLLGSSNNERVASNWIPLLCAKGSEIATGQITQMAVAQQRGILLHMFCKFQFDARNRWYAPASVFRSRIAKEKQQ